MTKFSAELLNQLRSNEPLLGSRVELSDQKIGDEGAKALADALCQNNTIKELDLSRNRIGKGGAKARADALCQNGTIVELYLGENSIGYEGAKALADALWQNASVTRLDLEENRIGDKGIKALADALCLNEAITILNLRGNSIGDEGAKALADALCRNDSISVLSLWRNRIGAEGAKALACAILLNATISSLDLYDNVTGEEGQKAFADAFHLLKRNDTSKEEALALMQALRPDLRLPLGTIASLGKQAAAQQLKRGANENTQQPAPSSGDVFYDLKHLDFIDQPRRAKIFHVMLKAGIKRMARKTRLVHDEFMPPMLERIGSHLGVAGIFAVLRRRPHLFCGQKPPNHG